MAPTHGKVSTYRTYGCRCPECTEANTVYCGVSRERRDQHPEDIPHGTESGYLNWGCRCDLCLPAGAQRRVRVLERAGGTDHERRAWTAEELATAARRDLTAVQIARLLGRSYGSVVGARHKINRLAATSTPEGN